VTRIQLNLLAAPGTGLGDVRRVVSIPVATAQCRGFFARELPNVELDAANSTAEAARYVGEARPDGVAAVGTALAAKLYGLEVLADCLRDLHAQLAGVKFLGSYPAAGEHGAAIRRDAAESWRAADLWISGLRNLVD